MKSKTGASKKPKNGDLPDGINYKVWCQFSSQFHEMGVPEDSPFN